MITIVTLINCIYPIVVTIKSTTYKGIKMDKYTERKGKKSSMFDQLSA